MTNNKQNTDKFFHDVALKYEESPPSYSWTNLADSLAAKKKKKRIVYFRLAAAVIALLFAFSIGYFYSGYKTNNNNPKIAKEDTKTDKQIKTLADDKSIDNSSDQNNLVATQTNETGKSEATYSNKNENIVKPPKQKKPTVIDNENQYTYKTKNVNKNVIEDKSDNIQIAQNPDNILSPDSSSSRQTKIIKEKFAVNTEQKPKQDTLKPDNIPDLTNFPEFTNPIVQNEPPKENRWSIGGELAPTYSYRSTNGLLNNNQESISNNLLTSPANTTNTYNEAPVVTYSGGINTRYELSTRWAFQSGVYYSKFGQTADYFDVITEADQSFSTNTTAGNLPLDHEIITNKPVYASTVLGGSQTYSNLIQYFEYLELPLAIRYKLIDRKIDLNLMSGIYTGFLIGNNAYVLADGNKESVGKTEGINSLIYSTMLGFGIEYSLSKKVSINLEPSFKYSLKSINKGSGYIYKPYSFGVFTGVNYKL